MAGTEDFDAAEVARKEFATGFRGFDQYEVRAYLAKLAAEMGVLQERERGLRERLLELERKRPSERVLADEEFEAALGTEATKVIHAARGAAAEIRAHAEENVARLLREAQDESQRLRTEAAGLLSLKTEEAEAAAARIVEAAQQKGREMVAEAQAVRERMLRDLARRRRHAEAQIQLLLGGRERLVEALEQAARVAGEATEQLGAVELADLPPIEATAAVPEEAPSAVADAPPPPVATPEASGGSGTGEQVVVAEPNGLAAPEPRRLEVVRPIDDRRAGRLLRRRSEAAVQLEDDVEGVRIIRPEPAAAAPETVAAEAAVEAGAPEPAVTDPEIVAADAVEDAEGGGNTADGGGNTAEGGGNTAEGGGNTAEGGGNTAEGGAELVEGGEPVAGEKAAGAQEGEAAADSEDGDSAAGTRSPTPVVELFARLRADRAAVQEEAAAEESPAPEAAPVEPDPAAVAAPDQVAEADVPEEPLDADPEGDDEPAALAEDPTSDAVEVDAVFEERDAAIDDAERALTRSLKRALADEQNEVLDSLRRLKGTPRVEVLLPEPEVHRGRYERVAAGPLGTAALAGLRSVDVVADGVDGVPVDALSAQFAEEVATDLRSRLARALDAGTGDSEALVEAISAGYREWKSARSEPTARHHAAAAYSAARYVMAPDEELRWVVDPAEGGCPDCDDNALAGPTRKGEAYPTGQLHPPAHLGCRCILRPVR